MNIQIHLSTASAIKDMIEEELSIKINTAAFLFGSIKPDLFSNLITAPHEIKHSQKFIENEIKSLLKENIINKKCSWGLSERLGIIMHYLSDFFCYAHTDSYKGSTFEHYYYEFTHLRYSFRSFKRIIRNFNKLYSFDTELKYVNEYLENQYSFFIAECPSKEIDLLYSLKICTAISFSIIVYLKNKYQHQSTKENFILRTA